jgi:prepilin-type N-terminal cleavage/methylation domain-containing protein
VIRAEGQVGMLRRLCRKSTGIGPARGARGVSLVEMIIVISIASIILGVVLVLMQWLLRSERDVRKTVWYGRSASRLARVFREDAHRAGKVEIVADGAESSNTMRFLVEGAHTVTYRIDEHTIDRIDRDGETELRRETFHFPPGSGIRFEKEDSPALARVVVDRATGQLKVDAADDRDAAQNRPESPRRTLQFEAGLGKDRRWTQEAPR